MSNKVSFKSDKYRKSRGGNSRWLLLYCEKCDNKIAIYQKDGSGILKRLYLDRILLPKILIDRTNKNLICKKCKTVLGIRGTYKKEGRLIFKLFGGVINKKVLRGNKISGINF